MGKAEKSGGIPLRTHANGISWSFSAAFLLGESVCDGIRHALRLPAHAL